MAIQYKALCMEMEAILRIRPCISIERNRCKANFSWFERACYRTIKYSEAEAFLTTKGIDYESDRGEILTTMENLGFIKMFRCRSSNIFFDRDYFTEDGETIILFP